MLEIYSNVGFFMFQIILDYKRKKDKLKINRYDAYSKIKIIENTEKYMEKIKDSYNELKNDATIFESNDQPDYHKYLQKIYKEMKERLIEYGYEVNDEEYNLSINNNPNNHNPNNHNPNNQNPKNNNKNPQEPAINSNINMDVRVYSSHINFQNNREQSARNMNTVNTNDRNEIKNEDFDTSKNIRKFKNAVRKINKLKKLYEEIDKETKEDINRLNMNKKCTCTCGFVILFIAFSIVLLTDFLLPILFDPEDDFKKSSEGNNEESEPIGTLIIGIIILIYPLSITTSSYTLIMIYATNRKKYISGDYLYDKQINDNISLLKTVQIVCGYSFSILYCNLYFWRTIDTHGHYGKPKFYETTFIPDYTFKRGITIFMIAKIIVIIGSMIGSYCLSSCNISCKKSKECKKCKITNIFQNDLGEFDRSGEFSRSDNKNKEKDLVVKYLEKE
jgi:hypothetical protein